MDTSMKNPLRTNQQGVNLLANGMRPLNLTGPLCKRSSSQFRHFPRSSHHLQASSAHLGKYPVRSIHRKIVLRCGMVNALQQPKGWGSGLGNPRLSEKSGSERLEPPSMSLRSTFNKVRGLAVPDVTKAGSCRMQAIQGMGKVNHAAAAMLPRWPIGVPTLDG